jgi:hypothetical protein
MTFTAGRSQGLPAESLNESILSIVKSAGCLQQAARDFTSEAEEFVR